jgi:hypothetical protein
VVILYIKKINTARNRYAVSIILWLVKRVVIAKRNV